ncbi:DUF4123 domain-containing protein [Geomonas sp. RF6]|uniref:DUF4123 domain-containing protein n=1 Tax=Geomonas sp. RF6 TaxID=2897342 RepID=UPI001E576E28|nr:DUF4123 domain-containing protein [Geomonas sp. RF6]UFS70707.1 DUF4123 domain-containing protein [Geomonas sp. RF6]
MIEQRAVNILKTHLFSGEPRTVFAILDGASVPDLPGHLAAFEPEYVCLYRGELEPDLAEMAPYLAVLERHSPFTEWVLTNGWGKHWGVFGTAEADLGTLRKHFRQFLIVHDESGKSLYFRYYDPRVCRIYLPTCNSDELKTVYGPVTSYLTEDDDAETAEKLFLTGSTLREEKISL